MAVCRWNNSVLLCLILVIILQEVTSFNLDTTIPIIKEGPANSFFGFSVAQHQELKRITFNKVDENDVVGN